MRRSTRSGREYGAGPPRPPSTNDTSVDPGGDRRGRRGRGDGLTDRSPKLKPTPEAPPTPKQRPLLRGWIHCLAIPYTVYLAYRLVLCAPTIGSAYAAIVSCFCSGLGYAISAYYHAVTHTPTWRAFVRKFDHAAIFSTIVGTYTPFIYRAYEYTGKSWLLGLLAADWLVALVGMANSIGGLTPNLTKFQRAIMYIVVGWLPMPVAGEAFGWDVYRWNSMGGAVYTLGGLMYGLQWPNLLPGVFGYHEMFHVLIVIANTLMMKGLEHAFLTY